MKKLIQIVKYLFLGILGLIITCSIGLLLYYETIFKQTPPVTEVSAKPRLSATSIQTNKPIILPIPKKIEWQVGHFNLTKSMRFSAPQEDAELIKKALKNRLNVENTNGGSEGFQFVKNKNLAAQAYYLSVQPNGIKIEYSEAQGLFYALTTVKQLAKQSDNQLPCVTIDDKPDLKTRGAMIDISRGKIPKLETLFNLVDFLSDLKYNQLQLYVEGFSFAYPSFKNLWEATETPITPSEIEQLDAYCKERYIELVPNQNSLGHMDAWLKTKEYKDLAECPEGYKLLGLIEMKSTLSPTNPKSLELVEKMASDLLPHFSSSQFNVNLDEPFELGKSKSHPITDSKEVAKEYLDYAFKLNDFVSSQGKNMMMWGDVVSRNPELISKIPKNITLLEWRYETFQQFDKICEKYRDAGLHYMVCPGTSSWSSFTGRVDNMLGNIENAVTNAIKYGSEGMLITDWGDSPHLQYATVSYPGLVYGAALSWNNNSAQTKSELGVFLSREVYLDKTNTMGDLTLELGRYNQFEEYPMISMTTTNMAYRFGVMDKTMLDVINKKFLKGIFELAPMEEDAKTTLTGWFSQPQIYNSKAIIDFVKGLENELVQTKMIHPDSALIIDEYKNAVRMIVLGAKLKQFNNYHLQQTDDNNKTLLNEMKLLCDTILNEHKRLWMQRNKMGGFEKSTENFSKLKTQIDDNLKLLDKNFISRWASRTLEKITTAGAALYLK